MCVCPSPVENSAVQREPDEPNLLLNKVKRLDYPENSCTRSRVHRLPPFHRPHDLSRVVRGVLQVHAQWKLDCERPDARRRRRLFTACLARFLPSTYPPPTPLPPLLNKFPRFSSRDAPAAVLSLVTLRRRHRKPPLFPRYREQWDCALCLSRFVPCHPVLSKFIGILNRLSSV